VAKGAGKQMRWGAGRGCKQRGLMRNYCQRKKKKERKIGVALCGRQCMQDEVPNLASAKKSTVFFSFFPICEKRRRKYESTKDFVFER